MNRTEILPAIIAKTPQEFDLLYDKFSPYFDTMHLDIMDGVFVAGRSLDFEFTLKPNKKYEAHLMVDKPEKWVRRIIHNFDTVIANFEEVNNPGSLIEYIKKKGRKVGFALNPGTEVFKIMPYAQTLDVVLLLAVNPGRYGATFQSEAYDKISLLRDFYKGDIEIDSGMNPLSAGICHEYGANRFAVGSYLQKDGNLKNAIMNLWAAMD